MATVTFAAGACANGPRAGSAAGRLATNATTPRAGDRIDPSALTPVRIRYAYTVRGRPAGGATYSLTRGDAGWRHIADISYGVPAFQTEHSEIAFRSDLTYVASDVQVRGGSTADITQRRLGTAGIAISRRYPSRPGRDTSYTVDAPSDAVVNLLDEVVLSVSPLTVGVPVRVPVVVTGALRDVRFTPTGVQQLTVRAGTFSVFRVDVRGYPGVRDESDVPQVWYVTTARPHRVVRQDLPSLSLVGEAVEIQ